MKPDKARQDEIRTPQQERSRKRVDQILDAARQIIAEKGLAAVTITEIAQIAGVTPGSMYQYFPNKLAIIDALGTRYLEEFRQRLDAEMDRAPQTAEEMAQAFEALLETEYRIGLEDASARDVWLGMATDTSLMQIFAAKSHLDIAALTEAARPLVRADEQDQLAISIALMFHFADGAIRVALGKPEVEGRADIDRAKSMLRLLWFSMV